MTSREFRRSRERAPFRAARPLETTAGRRERTLVRHPFHDLPLRPPSDRNAGRLGLRWFRAVVRFLFPGQGRRLSSRGAVVVCSVVIGLTSIVLARSGVITGWSIGRSTAMAERATNPRSVPDRPPVRTDVDEARARHARRHLPPRGQATTLDTFAEDSGISRTSYESTLSDGERLAP